MHNKKYNYIKHKRIKYKSFIKTKSKRVKGLRLLKISNLIFKNNELFHESVIGLNNESFFFQESELFSITYKPVEVITRKCT